MKTILVPTDFSEIANNALNYAGELAKVMGSTIILLHVYNLPLQSEYPNFSNESELKKNKEALQKLSDGIKMNEPDIKIELRTQLGVVTDVIKEVTNKKNADLIVIGLPETGVIEETILGNNAVDIIRDLTSPVLIIPAKASFKYPASIVFATDYLELKNDQTLYALVNFITLFKAKLHIVNVMKEDEKTSSTKVAAIINVKKIMKKINYFIYFPINENVVKGINEFVVEAEAEIIAMIPHKHTVFYKLFNLSNTKKMVFHTNVPILALPENMPKQEQQTENEVSSYTKIDFQYLEY